ncbi:hypothetical protein GS429_11465 [Natronorubrum sp. JWXQ-INN-674]|uniref:Uncharacterized protein n=1 Tax=Natronorubrum halalkaliphilum TaxID=2691917 RepID=A0A6B0VPI2_9EURY|nr:hypothetical protein [Natronorubrum halalkaliphilum]
MKSAHLSALETTPYHVRFTELVAASNVLDAQSLETVPERDVEPLLVEAADTADHRCLPRRLPFELGMRLVVFCILSDE